MKFVLIVGPHAVGKMTVGQELSQLTGLKLFHNHMTIDLVSQFFSYGTEQGKRLVALFRREIFEEVAKSDLAGMIFTYMWAFDQQSDWDYIDYVCSIFESQNSEIYLVELEADYDLRIERNKTPNRLENKPTKRDLEQSEKIFKHLEEKLRLNSHEGEIKREQYMRINNSDLPPKKVAQMICEHFHLG